MENIKWSEKVTNEQVLQRKGERRTLLNDIIRRKVNKIGHILRRNCLLHDAIEVRMMEKKVAIRRSIQLLGDLRDRRRYWKLKEDTDDPRS